MSLNWSLTKIDNWKTVCKFAATEEDKKNDLSYLRPQTEAIIMATMTVDLNDISIKNLEEWWWRLQFLRVYKGYRTFGWNREGEGHEDLPISPMEFTKEDLAKHIGLNTNVRNLNRKLWLKKQYASMELETDRRMVDAPMYPYPVILEEQETLFLKLRETAVRQWEEWKTGESIKETKRHPKK